MQFFCNPLERVYCPYARCDFREFHPDELIVFHCVYRGKLGIGLDLFYFFLEIIVIADAYAIINNDNR